MLSNNILKHKQKTKNSNIFLIANEKLFVQKILEIEYIKKTKSNNSWLEGLLKIKDFFSWNKKRITDDKKRGIHKLMGDTTERGKINEDKAKKQLFFK